MAYTHTPTRTSAYTHTYTHIHTLTLTHSSLTHTYTYALTRMHTHNTKSYTPSLSLTHSFTLCPTSLIPSLNTLTRSPSPLTHSLSSKASLSRCSSSPLPHTFPPICESHTNSCLCEVHSPRQIVWIRLNRTDHRTAHAHYY